MDFIRYNSIENSYKEKFVNDVSLFCANVNKWHVTEKIHGANFSFWWNNGEFKVARRNSFIDDDESFFNYQTMVDKYKDQFISMCTRNGDSWNDVVLYGEYYGPKICTGVDYGSEYDFAAIKLVVDGESIPFETMSDVLAVFTDIKTVPLLFTGTLNECMEFDIQRNSILIDKEDNIIEGIVISPYIDITLPSGKAALIKKKNKKFLEKKQGNPKPKIPIIDTITDEWAKECALASLSYVTENRMMNVFSKIGVVDNLGKMIKPFVSDVMEEFSDDYDLSIISKENKNKISKIVSGEVSTMVRDNIGVFLE